MYSMSKCDRCTSALSSSSVCNLMSGVEVRVEVVLSSCSSSLSSSSL